MCAQLFEALVAVRAGHVQVEQNGVGPCLRYKAEHLVAALRNPDNLDSLCPQGAVTASTNSGWSSATIMRATTQPASLRRKEVALVLRCASTSTTTGTRKLSSTAAPAPPVNSTPRSRHSEERDDVGRRVVTCADRRAASSCASKTATTPAASLRSRSRAQSNDWDAGDDFFDAERVHWASCACSTSIQTACGRSTACLLSSPPDPRSTGRRGARRRRGAAGRSREKRGRGALPDRPTKGEARRDSHVPCGSGRSRETPCLGEHGRLYRSACVSLGWGNAARTGSGSGAGRRAGSACRRRAGWATGARHLGRGRAPPPGGAPEGSPEGAFDTSPNRAGAATRRQLTPLSPLRPCANVGLAVTPCRACGTRASRGRLARLRATRSAARRPTANPGR